MEDPGPTIIEALERDGFIVLQSYDDRADQWTVSAALLSATPELRYTATASGPTEAVIEVAAMAGYLARAR
jgi:hypothetical protein